MDYLSVSSYHYDGFPVIEVSGELDFETREQLGKRLHKVISTHNPAHVIVHVNGLEFCDAAGLAVLGAAHRQAGQRSGGLRLVSRKPSFRRLLEASGLSDSLPLYKSLAEAAGQPVGARTGQK